jgi:hypothetical protein
MKILSAVFFVVLWQTSICAQTLPEWYRVYTFDDKSTIELNTDYVMFSTDHTGRVRFRWNYVEAQTLGRDRQLKYRSRISEYQFDCQNRSFRFYNDRLFDAAGKLVSSKDNPLTDDWRRVRSGNIMQTLFGPACNLIEFRKREPAVER